LETIRRDIGTQNATHMNYYSSLQEVKGRESEYNLDRQIDEQTGVNLHSSNIFM